MNIQPANRLSSVSEYYFSAKLREVGEMNAAGKNVINLGIGNPDLPPSEATINALCSEAKKPNVHGYQSYVGIPELRTGFAHWYQKWYHVTLNPSTEIQPLIGSKEGILHLLIPVTRCWSLIRAIRLIHPPADCVRQILYPTIWMRITTGNLILKLLKKPI